VEAPPTPQKTETSSHGHLDPSASSLLHTGSHETSSPIDNRHVGLGNNNSTTLPKFSRPSPLFLDGSSSGEHEPNPPQGSSADDEEHKIRVGTYLEGGPCGTYAVAVKTGLLVYPTLFEHALPSALNGLRKGEDEDIVKRDVEELVKKHYRESGAGIVRGEDEDDGDRKIPVKLKEKEKEGNDTSSEAITANNDEENDDDDDDDDDGPPKMPNDETELGSVSQTTELGSVSQTTWVECHEDENVEAQCSITELFTKSCESGSMTYSPSPIMGLDISTTKEEDEKEEEGNSKDEKNTAMSDLGSRGDQEEAPTDLEAATAAVMDAMSDPGIDAETATKSAAMLAAACDTFNNDNVGLCVSLTISEDDDTQSNNSEGDDDFNPISASVRTMPARRCQSNANETSTRSTSPLSTSLHHNRSTEDDTTGSSSSANMSKKFVRHISLGSYPTLNTKSSKSKESAMIKNDNDEFERPLIRLKYGDRVQVVSMDSRGWVKLARGYGYIRLENDKQLVKVGGTSDKACQIEAMLHELSIERNRLKHEQTKLERLSAGLMIDLQTSLLMSDDHVVVPAPKGSFLRTDSELSLSSCVGGKKDGKKVTVDDIDVSTRSRAVLTPPRSIHEPYGLNSQQQQHGQAHREIRTAKSHSPGRTIGTQHHANSKPPPSPPYGQQVGSNTSTPIPTVSTPTRVNFRTGLSGHRALTSSHAHPHDFLGSGSLRSMSNHAGISSSKKTASTSRGRSIY